MNLERHIRRLNRLLASELGVDPPYRWVHSHSRELQHPMAMYHEDGSPVIDYHCACGINVRIHSPSCRISAARQRVGSRSTLCVIEDENGMLKVGNKRLSEAWVVVTVREVSKEGWVAAYGTLANYPDNGVKWLPQSFSRAHPETGNRQPLGFVVLDHVPTLDDTYEFIKQMRSAMHPDELDYELDSKNQSWLERRKQERLYTLRHAMRAGMNLIPGQKNNVSFPIVKH